MFIPDNAVVKAVLMSKTELAHQFQRFSDEIGFNALAAFSEQIEEFFDGDVPFRLKKYFKNFKPIFKSVDIFLLKKNLKLFFFLGMDLFHKAT